MPGLEIMEKAALEKLLADAPTHPGYVSVAVVGERSPTGRKRERQIGRVDCPEPRLLGRIGRIFRDAVPPGSSAKLRVRRYGADGHKTEQLVEVSRPRGPSLVDRMLPPDPAPAMPAPNPRTAERDPTLASYLTPIATRPGDTGSGASNQPAGSAAAVGPPDASAKVGSVLALANDVPGLPVGLPQLTAPADFTFVLAEMARLNAEVVRLNAELARRDAEMARVGGELARRDADMVRQQARSDRQEAALLDVRKALAVMEGERDQLLARLQAEIAARAADDEHMAAQLEELNEMMESTPSWASLLG
jgi:hypothetical protein